MNTKTSSHLTRLVLFLKGMLMGIADVIPGVSGGTIAFITGIYPQLLSAINSLDSHAFKLLINVEFKKLWLHINGPFILVLCAGILLSVFLFANLIKFLLVNHAIKLWALFFGLIFGSVIVLLRSNPIKNISELILLLLGFIVAISLSTIAPSPNTDATLIQMFLAGSMALCAMILPGISGSFILLILGFYSTFIDAVANLKLQILIAFFSGGFIGLMLFSRLLTWIIKRSEKLFISCICGFLLGSLVMIWPWRLQQNSGDVSWYENISPRTYEIITGNDPQIILCVFLFSLGTAIVQLLGNPNVTK